MFTVMYWIPKSELRAINLQGNWRSPTHEREFKFLPEHSLDPPMFQTAEEAWTYIREKYPHLQP